MKKFFTIIVLGLLFATPLFSQHFYIGIGGAVNSIWITNVKNSGWSDMDYKTKFGPSFGLNIGYQFNKHMALFIQPGYGAYGQKLEDSHDVIDTVPAEITTSHTDKYSRDINLKYFQIPILFKYSVGGEVTRFFIAIGPQINMLLSAKQDFTKNDAMWEEVFENPNTNKTEIRGKEDIKDHYNSLDIAARLDFGLEFVVVKKLMIDAGLSLGYGLMDINASDWHVTKLTTDSYAPSHNIFGGFSVGVNYIF